MADTWSGTIVYEWISEENDYGLISYGRHIDSHTRSILLMELGPKVDPEKNPDALDGFPRSGTPTPVSPDYTNLKKHWETLSPTGVKSSEYRPYKKAPACPSATVSGWAVNGDVLLPTLGQVLNRATATKASTAGTASATGKGAATGGREIAGMGVGLVGVMLGFVAWL